MYLPICLLLLAYHANCQDHEDIYITEAEENTEYTENLNDIGKFHDEAEPYQKELEKRGAAAVLFGATLFLTLLNVGTDIFLGENGCCKIQKTRDDDACEKLPNVQSMTKKLAFLGKKMDEEHALSRNSMTYLDHLNNQNFVFRNEIKRLRDLEESIVETMDPKLVNEFKTKVAQIKTLLGNSQDLSAGVLDITELYKPLYKSWEGRLALFGTVGVQIVGEIGEQLFNRAVMNNLRRDIQPELAHKLQMQQKGGPKATKILGGTDDIRVLTSSMAKTKNKMTTTKTNQGKIVRGFTHFMGVVAIGFEIYQLYNKFKSCDDSYKNLRRTEQKLIKLLANATGTYDQIKGKRTEIDNQYKAMKDALADQKVLDIIGDFHKFVIQAAPAARRRMRPAEIKLPVFAKYIQVESPSLTWNLQGWLIEGLQSIKIRYECLKRRVKATVGITSDCKKGLKDLSLIYKDRSKEQELHKCVTEEKEPFTTFEQIKEFVDKDSKSSKDHKEWYNTNCLMNDKNLINTMCDNHCKDGHSYEHALKTKKVTTITISELKDVCEPNGKCERVLTPNEIEQICLMKDDRFTITLVKRYTPKLPADKVEEAYEACRKKKKAP